jgi:hypothetical protein
MERAAQNVAYCTIEIEEVMLARIIGRGRSKPLRTGTAVGEMKNSAK